MNKLNIKLLIILILIISIITLIVLLKKESFHPGVFTSPYLVQMKILSDKSNKPFPFFFEGISLYRVESQNQSGAGINHYYWHHSHSVSIKKKNGKYEIRWNDIFQQRHYPDDLPYLISNNSSNEVPDSITDADLSQLTFTLKNSETVFDNNVYLCIHPHLDTSSCYSLVPTPPVTVNSTITTQVHNSPTLFEIRMMNGPALGSGHLPWWFQIIQFQKQQSQNVNESGAGTGYYYSGVDPGTNVEYQTELIAIKKLNDNKYHISFHNDRFNSRNIVSNETTTTLPEDIANADLTQLTWTLTNNQEIIQNNMQLCFHPQNPSSCVPTPTSPDSVKIKIVNGNSNNFPLFFEDIEFSRREGMSGAGPHHYYWNNERRASIRKSNNGKYLIMWNDSSLSTNNQLYLISNNSSGDIPDSITDADLTQLTWTLRQGINIHDNNVKLCIYPANDNSICSVNTTTRAN